MKDVYNFIKNLNIKSEYIIAAISGGPDSMLLLKFLIDISKKLNKKIVVAHVHHNVRKESDEEALMLEKIVKENNLIFEFKKIEKYPNNRFSEEYGREFRYNFFEELINKYNSDILFTAHHGDDLIETILMRISRGSSLKGYAGFEETSVRKGYIIARPLIHMTKSEILKELGNWWFATDVSNDNEMYKRNKYRKKILPVLKEYDNNVNNKFLDFSKTLLSADKYISKQMNLCKDEIIVNNVINVCKFNELDDIIKIYLLEDYLRDIYSNKLDRLNKVNINLIIDLLKNKVNSKISMPFNKIGILEYNNFKIIDSMDKIAYDYEFLDNLILPNGKKIYIDNKSTDGSNFTIHLNTKEISFPLHIRTKKDGDFMYVKNLNGKKSVSDILTNAKVSKEHRDTYPILTDNDGVILWIPGIKKSNLDRKNSNNYDIIIRYS